MSSDPDPELARRTRLKKRLLGGWLIAQIPLVFLLFQYYGGHSNLITAATPTILLEGIEVDHTSITEVELHNNSSDEFFLCGDTGRCSEKYCLFAKGPVLNNPLKGGATIKIRVEFTPAVAGPFSEEISVYCRCEASMETVTFRVRGFAVSGSK